MTPTAKYSKKISIIVVATNFKASVENCLNSIFNSKYQENIEIIVALGNYHNSIKRLLKIFPSVQFIQFAEKAGIPKLTAEGIKNSTGEIIALVDSSCIVDKDWINSIIQAHRSPFLVFGGMVKPLGKMRALDLAGYFCEYGRFMPPLKAGFSDVLPGNNISFKRAALQIGDKFIEPEFWKTFWCEELLKSNVKLMLEPKISVYYTKKFSFFSFLGRRIRHGRCYAGMRIQSATLAKRLVYIGGAAFLPAIFLFRIFRNITEKEVSIKEIFYSCPYILLAVLCWSAGEFLGYLVGTGNSCNYID